MKIIRAAIFGRTMALAATLFGVATAARAAAPTDTTVTAAVPKDYVVFFGLDVFANDGTRSRRIVDASGREVLVMDQEGTTPIQLREVRLKSEVIPKLSRTGVTIADLVGEPVYSAEADPMAQSQTQQMMLESVQADAVQAADVGKRQAETMLGIAMASGRSEVIAAAQTGLRKADVKLEQAHVSPALRGVSPGQVDNDAGYDGFEVSFRVSASEPHARAYGVLRLRIRDPREPGVTVQALKVFRLRELGSKPRKASVRVIDLPPGFTIESYQVHVYADGGELATNLSPNRVELTADEAHQYFVMRHAHHHRGATLPAQVLTDLEPRAALPKLVVGQESTLVNLGITAEGRVDQVGGDAVTSAPLSAPLEAALRELRFLPALVNGQPAASTGTFALGELFSSR